MRFSSEIDGHEVVVRFDRDNALTFSTNALPGKSFNTVEEIQKAITTYNLSLRKNFNNPEARM